MNNLDYYLLVWSDPTNSVPLIRGVNRIGYLRSPNLLSDITTVRMEMMPPIPRNPLMADYIGPKNVISLRVAEELKKLDLPYLQFVPVIINDNNKNEFNYIYLRICNRISCIDLEKSDCIYDEHFNCIYRVKSIVLSNKILSSISLDKRLIFVPKKIISELVFHASVVEKIMNLKPIGLRFVKVEDWKKSVQFK